jgi:hypothetical protein
MKRINIPIDVSILLDGPEGVGLYIEQDELPSQSIPLYNLVSEYIDAFSIDGRIAEEHEEDAYELIKQLHECIALLGLALPE